MASSVPSFINFRSFGISGHLTQYADGSFLTVWTDLSAKGDAYAYGKVFKADGSLLRDTFLIDHAPPSATATYTDITAATLSDGRTLVAWVKGGDTRTIVGKVLSVGFTPSSELLSLGEDSVTSQEAPQIYALQNGGFSVVYQGKLSDDPVQVGSIATEQGGRWESVQYRLDYDGIDPKGSVTLGTGTFASFYSYSDQGTTRIEVDLVSAEEVKTISVDTLPGVTDDIVVTASPIGSDKFVVAWEDVEGSSRVIRAQVFDSAGGASPAITFSKPSGTLEGNPVIKQLSGGGFAIAFTVDVGNGDKNVYTAAARADGTILTNTTHVGTSTAGDQWDPSLIPLSGNNYAVSWLTNGEGSQQIVVEVISVSGTSVPTHNPDPIWPGTTGNDVYTGTAASDVLKGLGGKDTIDGREGDDVLWGGLGNDILKGGDGRDIFVFDTRPNKSTNKDKLVDFSVKDDGIWLDNKVFTKLGKAGSEAKPAKLKKDFFVINATAKDKNDYLVYDKKKGLLLYDADGSGKGKAVEIASLPKNLKMTAADFFVI